MQIHVIHKMHINPFKYIHFYRNLFKSYPNPSRNLFFREKSARGNREDLTKLITYHKILETSFWTKNKTPAAAGKTSPSLHTHTQKRWKLMKSTANVENHIQLMDICRHPAIQSSIIEFCISRSQHGLMKNSLRFDTRVWLQEPKRAYKKKVCTSRRTDMAPGAETGSYKIVDTSRHAGMGPGAKMGSQTNSYTT